MTDYISIAEAATLLGVSRARVRALIDQQRLRASKIGHQLVLLRADVLALERMPVGRHRSTAPAT